LPSYGPYEMLETMTEFILDMRKQYLQADKNVVVVTHDWGALTGARLASEASQLADRWIITSGIIVSPPVIFRRLATDARIATFNRIEYCNTMDLGQADASHLDPIAFQSSLIEDLLYCSWPR
jgi:predicted alpha/beta hydrolase family esterase